MILLQPLKQNPRNWNFEGIDGMEETTAKQSALDYMCRCPPSPLGAIGPI